MFEVCRKCFMPNTRPHTKFVDGVCQACLNFDTRKNVDWGQRFDELKRICDRYRSKDGSWDVIVPVSGGKDSHAMVYLMREVMGMHPLLVTVADIFGRTNAGLNNIHNIQNAFNVDKIHYTISPDLDKRMNRYCFEKWLDPLRYTEQLIQVFPFKLGVKLGIPFVFRGEDSYVYGSIDKERISVENSLIKEEFNTYNIDFWESCGFSRDEFNGIIPPTNEELEKLQPFAPHLSYFIPWSSLDNLKIARRYGFQDLTHEWRREGCAEDFEQIDSKGYLVHLWLKYPKFGFQRTSDIVGRRLREGAMTVEEAKKAIIERDSVLDQVALNDFCDTLGYTRRQFWDVVENFWNRELFEKDGVIWRMKVSRLAN